MKHIFSDTLLKVMMVFCMVFGVLVVSAEEAPHLENLALVRPSDGGALRILEVEGRSQLCDSSGNRFSFGA